MTDKILIALLIIDILGFFWIIYRDLKYFDRNREMSKWKEEWERGMQKVYEENITSSIAIKNFIRKWDKKFTEEREEK
jgi:hypothetical protein